MSSSNANYSYPLSLSRYPPLISTHSPTTSSHAPRMTKHQPAVEQHFTSMSRSKKIAPPYGSSRSTTTTTTTLSTSFIIPPMSKGPPSSGAAPFSLDPQPRMPTGTTATAEIVTARTHTRKDSRFDDASEDVEEIESAERGTAVQVCGNRRPFAPIVINIQGPDQQRQQQQTERQAAPPPSFPKTQNVKPSSLKPSSRNYSLVTYSDTDAGNDQQQQQAHPGKGFMTTATTATAIPTPPAKLLRNQQQQQQQQQHTPNRLRKPNTSSPAAAAAGGSVTENRSMKSSALPVRQVGNGDDRGSWKAKVGAAGGRKKVSAAVVQKEEEARRWGGDMVGYTQQVRSPSFQHAFGPPSTTATPVSFRSRIPLPVPPLEQSLDVATIVTAASNADKGSMKSVALSIASDPFAVPRMMRKKASIGTLGLVEREKEEEKKVNVMPGFEGKRGYIGNQHGLPLPPPPPPTVPTMQASPAPPPLPTQMISKKKSMLAFTTSMAIGGQKNEPSSAPTGPAAGGPITVGKRIGGLVKMPSGGFGLRRLKHGGGGVGVAGDVSFSLGHVDGDDDGDSSVVAAASTRMVEMKERQSTDSNFSMMSDWTITNFSDISGELPGRGGGVDGERYNRASEEQNGGLPTADVGNGRKLGKKKSFAAAGVFLGKILHGSNGGGAGEKKERRKSEVAAYNKLPPRRLRNEASTMTLRPTDAFVEGSSNATEQSMSRQAFGRERSPSPASTIRSRDASGQFQAIRNPTPTALAPASHPSAVHSTTRSRQPIKGSETGYNRAKSPELPSLHFPKLSYTGTNFRADLSMVGNALEMAPPVPPIPATFSSPVGNTVRQEPRLCIANPDVQSLASTWSPAPAYTETMTLRAGAPAADVTTSAHRVQSSYDYSQYSQESSGESSLVHVEHALDISDEYSFISKNSSIVDGGEKRFSGRLPWRMSVQGVFGKGEDEARRDESHVMVESLLGNSSLDKRPSLVDLKKVSNMTGSLQALVAAYNTSPSTLNDLGDSPTDGEAGENDERTPDDLAVRLDSPSSSHIMDHDSPTPMRKYGYDRQGKSSRLTTPHLGASPLQISPLRLALGNSTVKSQQERRTDENDSYLSRRIFEDNPFLTSRKASMATLESSVPLKTVGGGLALCRQRRLSNGSSSDEDESPLARRIDKSSDSFGLPPLPTVLMGNDRMSKDTQETVSSLDGDALPRESFDFTEEYRALNENGSRQSFMDELERLGLSSGEDSFRIEKPELESGTGVGLEAGVYYCDPTTRETTGHVRRNSYGFNKNFRFGVTKQAFCSTLSTVSSNKVKQTPYGGMSSPPKEPLPVPQPTLGTNNRFHFKPNPEDSMFSIATMSSVGPVVDTGIAGTDFVNVFDREFGVILSARDKTSRTLHHQSSNTSSIDSFSNGPIHLRRPSHARISSFASLASRSVSFRQHAFMDPGHHRQQSSLDSNRSILRKVGRPNVDSDRMFETDTRKQLYSIQGSPAALTARNAATKPSKDSILDSSRHMTTPDSILDNIEDFIFRSGTRKAKSSTFAIKPIRPLSHISDAPEPKASLSPLGIKTRLRHPIAEDSLLDVSMTEPVKQEEEAVEQCLQADTEVSIEDASFNSNLSFVSGGMRRPARPKNARSSRPSSALFPNAGLPALLTPGHSEFSSQQSTDVHSIISTMVDGGTEARWSRQLKGLSQLSEKGIAIEKPVPLVNGAGHEEQLSPPTGRKGGLTRWVDYQRLVEAEVLKSKTTWQDSVKSVQVIAEFVPPSTAEGIRSVIRNSLDLSRPLCEASPGTQITRREQHEVERGMLTAGPVSDAKEPSSIKPLALPSKFMRANSAKSGIHVDSGSTDTAATRPVSAVFAKFAIPTEPTPARRQPTGVPLVIKAENTVTASHEVKKIKTPIVMRSRVNSTARRQKLGWARRKDVGPASPARGKRTVAKLAHKSLGDANKENVVQTTQTLNNKRKAIGQRPPRKPSTKALRA